MSDPRAHLLQHRAMNPELETNNGPVRVAQHDPILVARPAPDTISVIDLIVLLVRKDLSIGLELQTALLVPSEHFPLSVDLRTLPATQLDRQWALSGARHRQSGAALDLALASLRPDGGTAQAIRHVEGNLVVWCAFLHRSGGARHLGFDLRLHRVAEVAFSPSRPSTIRFKPPCQLSPRRVQSLIPCIGAVSLSSIRARLVRKPSRALEPKSGPARQSLHGGRRSASSPVGWHKASPSPVPNRGSPQWASDVGFIPSPVSLAARPLGLRWPIPCRSFFQPQCSYGASGALR